MALNKKNTFYVSQKALLPKSVPTEGFGIRGRRAVEFAEMNLPVLPGLVFDASVADGLEDIDFDKDLRIYFDRFAQEVGKRFGDTDHALLVKLVFSPNLAIANYPLIHNLGLAEDTVDGFADKVGKNFAANELVFLMRGVLTIRKSVAELEGNEKAVKELDACLQEINTLFKSDKITLSLAEMADKYRKYMPEGFFDGAKSQLISVLKLASRLLKLDDQNDRDTALLIQPMVYGNYTKGSCSGSFTTRNVVTGEKKLQGSFFAEKFDEVHAAGEDINKVGAEYLKDLEKVAARIEDSFKEIRQIRFTIENGKLWFIEQRSVEQKSTVAQIKLLLDLNRRKIIDEAALIQSLRPDQLSEILHPVIDLSSVKKFPCQKGGISGAPGAAVGRVYFSTEALLDANRAAKQKSQDSRCILLMPATYAGDVKAIEVADGVLSNEGGYSAHASVVARQYGKISLVRPDMRITGKKAKIGDMLINEGDYITLNVPFYGEPQIFKGEASLIQPNAKEAGMLDIVAICKKFTGDFTVRANADSPRDAELALMFGAAGIGLCRTEHMFFHEDRINVFRQMILSSTPEDRKAALAKLQKMQASDFYRIFKVMAGKHVTIRLLDAPLHEFLPHNSAELAKFMEHMESAGGKNTASLSKAEILARIDALAEFNPMLGHRGCRIAVSYPEIYEMQIRAVFEAACKLQKEKVSVLPEVMIPIIMNST